MRPIQMVDLVSQYRKIKSEIDEAWTGVLENASFINGPEVKSFAKELEDYLEVKHVIPCANGTDAIQAAFMALDLPRGSEVITPSFSYAALAEMIIHLGLKPVFVEVDEDTFTLSPRELERALSSKTKAIAPVHLYGQCADMNEIMDFARLHNLYVVEDTAQAIGANYTLKTGERKKAGTIGHIGTTSFFPSKNLGCYGDGGAIFTNDDYLAAELRKIVNHGQKKKYVHDRIGLNSRLDSLQAAVLRIKLKHLDGYANERKRVANFYNRAFSDLPWISTPVLQQNSEHVYHQYTCKLNGVDRDELRNYLNDKGIPSMVYYPIPLHRQNAYAQEIQLPLTDSLTECVISLPISTELDEEQLNYITQSVKAFDNQRVSI